MTPRSFPMGATASARGPRTPPATSAMPTRSMSSCRTRAPIRWRSRWQATRPRKLQSTTQVAGQANAFQYTATASGTATQLQVFLDDGTMASQVQVGLYSDSGGHPGTLLTQGTINTPVNWAWNAVPVPPVSVTANTKYWIAVLSPTGAGKIKLLYRDSNGTRGLTNPASRPRSRHCHRRGQLVRP